ncbi:MAG: enoyl-CoA hydratase/isomerase family protein [Chloroflexi bacterium]|nr:enoyl-CoA hydratase/isomerase family protein [Chloroflexota bacterium]
MTATHDLTFDTLQLTQSGRVLTARYACPPLNFLTAAGVRDLDHLTSAVDRDPTVGAVVLTGGMEGRFLTHVDPHEFGALAKLPHPQVSMRVMEFVVPLLNLVLGIPGVVPLLERFGGVAGKGLAMGFRWKRTILRMNRSRAVYIAAINGPVLEGGLEIVLACDLRYAADAAHLRMGLLEMLVGLIPGGSGTNRLLRMLGTARALEHILEGAPLTASEALTAGLVHRVVPADQLLAEAQKTAARLARRSPFAVAALKRCLYFGAHLSFSSALNLELAGFTAAGLTPAAGRVVQPFLDDLERFGESPELADPEPWIEGTRVDLVG